VAELIGRSPHVIVRRPPYTPTVAPIEQCFHSVKMTLRRNRASLTAHNLGEMIEDAVEELSPSTLSNFFANCGY
jgi:transposase